MRGADAAEVDEHRRFDFWIGAWNVTQHGQPAGTNLITSDLNGRVLLESWTGTSGVRGRSMTFYDRARRRWHQTWIDSDGGVLELNGVRTSAALVLEGEGIDPDSGRRIAHRISWTPNVDGTVRQHWEQREDDHRGWTTAFDGLYRRER